MKKLIGASPFLLFGLLFLCSPALLFAVANQWVRIGPNAPVVAMAVDPLYVHTIYAAGSYSNGNTPFYRTSNGGSDWSTISTFGPVAGFYCITFDPHDRNNIYVGTDQGGVFKSTDGGGTWKKGNSGIGDLIVTAITVDPSDSSVIYAGCWWGGLYKSIDSGASWGYSGNGLEGVGGYNDILIDPTNHNVLYVPSLNSKGVYKSSNGGISWAATNTGLTDLKVHALVVDPVNSKVLYAATDAHGVFKTVNGGANWSQVSVGLGPAGAKNLAVLSLVIDPVNHNTLCAGTNTYGIFRTTNGGTSWRPYNTGLAKSGGGLPSNVAEIDFAPSNSSMMFAATADGIFTVTVSAQDTSEATLFVPVVLSTQGLNLSFFTTELTLGNKGGNNTGIEFRYTPMNGDPASVYSAVLPARQQMIIPDAIAYLSSHGVNVPMPQIGTLAVSFQGLSSILEAAVTARTTTVSGNGRAGLAYVGIPTSSALISPAYLCGLRQNTSDRSNVAFQNAGAPGDGDITLKVTVYSGDSSVNKTLGEYVLPPGGFRQISGVLNEINASNGYVRIERTLGAAPYYAYGIINDQANSDGSFVPPQLETTDFVDGLTLPVVVETGVFTSEVVLTNWSRVAKVVYLNFVADNVNTPTRTASVQVSLNPGQQKVIPNLLQYMRDNNVKGIATGTTYAGAVFASGGGGNLNGIVLGARTSAPGGGGRYGLFYTAVPFGFSSVGNAWVFGLQQDTDNRTNLAIVNTGESDSSNDTFAIDLYNGDTGQFITTVTSDTGYSLTLKPRGWLQLNSILAAHAPGVLQGYANIRRISGTNPFVAYAVVNDGASSGKRTGDGAFLPSSQ